MQGGVSPGDPWGPFSGLKTMNDIIIGWVEILTDYHPILHAITFWNPARTRSPCGSILGLAETHQCSPGKYWITLQQHKQPGDR